MAYYNKKTTNNDVYSIITDKIIAMMEQGTIPWNKPWKVGVNAPSNYVSDKEYNGINALLLQSLGFDCKYFATFKQIKANGGMVKKGQKGFPVIYWNIIERKKLDANGQVVKKKGKIVIEKIPLLRYYTVFNLEQQEGIEIPEPTTEEPTFNPIKKAESIVSGYKNAPKLVHEEQRAYYVPATDKVNMPKNNTFNSSEEYYSTLFHEYVHSTGHEKRLSREGITESDFFGGHKYSKEELVAEFGASFLCAECHIEKKTIKNSAAYLQSWIKALNNDKKMLVQAASKAKRAVEHILNKERKEDGGEEVKKISKKKTTKKMATA